MQIPQIAPTKQTKELKTVNGAATETDKEMYH